MKQLAATSKRPIVLTATTLTHSLQKALDTLHAGYANSSSNVLYFSLPSVPRIVLHMRLICAAESGGQECMKGAPSRKEDDTESVVGPSTRDLVTLARASGCDIRSAMNTLQLWSQSPYPSVTCRKLLLVQLIISKMNLIPVKWNEKTRRGKRRKQFLCQNGNQSGRRLQ